MHTTCRWKCWPPCRLHPCRDHQAGFRVICKGLRLDLQEGLQVHQEDPQHLRQGLLQQQDHQDLHQLLHQEHQEDPADHRRDHRGDHQGDHQEEATQFRAVQHSAARPLLASSRLRRLSQTDTVESILSRPLLVQWWDGDPQPRITKADTSARPQWTNGAMIAPAGGLLLALILTLYKMSNTVDRGILRQYSTSLTRQRQVSRVFCKRTV